VPETCRRAENLKNNSTRRAVKKELLYDAERDLLAIAKFLVASVKLSVIMSVSIDSAAPSASMLRSTKVPRCCVDSVARSIIII